MLAGKKPATEPLARLVPRDNYYLHFKSVRKFVEAGELFDEWGTTVTRTWLPRASSMCTRSGSCVRGAKPA